MLKPKIEQTPSIDDKRNSVVILKSFLAEKKNEIVADDDLESQMDDYMIESASDVYGDEEEEIEIFDSQDSSSSNDKNSTISNTGGIIAQNLQDQVLEQMEEFYDTNFETRHILMIEDIYHEKIWSVYYDDQIDILYIFVAKIKQIRGSKFTNLTKIFGLQPKKSDKTHFQKFDIENEDPNDFDNTFKNLSAGEKALQYFIHCTIEFHLDLQVWNIDDRVVKDKNHRKRPIATLHCIRKLVEINEPMNTFEHMNHLQNMFQSYARLHQNESYIHFFTGNSEITTYDTVLKNQFSVKVRSNENTCKQLKSYQSTLHYKDVGTIAQSIENIIQLGYYHSEKHSCQVISPDVCSDENEDNNIKKIQQDLTLRLINYKVMQDCKYMIERNGRQMKSKDQSITFRDDQLIKYYENNQGRKIKDFFIQRLQDTGTYLVIFPTGLLLLLSIFPFNIMSKINLNLQSNETIIDFCYCISDSRKNHCIWMLDEKNQVWKCTNEMNINSINWNLTKVEYFDHLFYKKFFLPGMCYKQFQLMTVLNKLECFQKLNENDNNDSNEYIFAFNGTTSRGVYVKQPLFENTNYREDDIDLVSPKKNSLGDMIRNKLQLSKLQLESSQINVFLICKNQKIIINQIPQKQTLLANLSEHLNFQVTQKIGDIKKKSYHDQQRSFTGDLENIVKQKLFQVENIDNIREKIQLDNEIYEVRYLRKIKLDPEQKDQAKNQPKIKIQFLIRRKRTLEIMLTNGLNYQTKFIQDSMVSYPFHISDLSMSTNKRTIIAYYSIEGNDSQVSIKYFEMQANGLYKIKNTDDIQEIKNCKNVYLDDIGNLQEIKIQISKNSKSLKSPLDNIIVDRTETTLDIRIPSPILPKGLFEQSNNLERVIVSDNQRILMCGKVLIQLSRDLEDVQEIGCIIHKKDNSNNIKYQFQSLLQRQSARQIIKDLKSKPDIFVSFSLQLPPISPQWQKDIMYFPKCYDGKTGDSSVVKLDTQTLDCFEVYQSNFKIVHMSILDRRDNELVPGKPEKIPEVSTTALWKGVQKAASVSDIQMLKTNNELKDQISKFQENRKLQKKRILISLVSQQSNFVNVEIISHQNCVFKQREPTIIVEPEENSQELLLQDECLQGSECDDRQNIQSQKRKTMIGSLKKKSIHFINDHGQTMKCRLENRASLELFLNISIREKICLMSEIGWINKNQLILTLNNEFYLINLKHPDLTRTKNGIMYGIQQVNMGLYCSIVKRQDKSRNKHVCSNNIEDIEFEIMNQTKYQKTESQIIIQSQKSICRMEIASLRRYAMIRLASRSSFEQMSLLFFTPGEELNGGNIFSKVSNKFNVMQPYLEKIDSEFISLMNQKVQNIALFVSQNYQIINGTRAKIEKEDTQKLPTLKDNNEVFQLNQGIVHMYQNDISGQNVIDYAFKKNAIFCIKAFVDTLLVLTEEKQFRNCIDKALLLMINRGMDVKELVNSELFYPQIWQSLTLFSPCEDMVIIPHSGELDDLEFQDPNLLFSSNGIMDQNFDESTTSYDERILMSSRQSFYINFAFKFNKEDTSTQDQYEMKYNYIYMREIEESDKMSVSRALKDCKDIKLFEQEAIKVIIDYKWDTYGKSFFLIKFFVYSVFLFLYYLDLESIHGSKLRVKGFQFIFCKSVCSIIQAGFLAYEIMQIRKEIQNYWLDPWNYLELSGMFFFFTGVILDLVNEKVTDQMRIIFCLSILMSLVKIVYLVRVFKSLNFLVTMLENVVNEVIYFMILFCIFLLTFAECNHIVQVDITQYGRIPGLIAHIITILRCAMGDFASLDSNQTFDIIQDKEADTEEEYYRHHRSIVYFTWVLFIVSIFYLFMIFMNFIIAVISDSYNTVIENKDSHDYLQRIVMIYEREVHFNQKQLEDKKYFPEILIVRKKKDNNTAINHNNWQGMMNLFKNYVKQQTQVCIDSINQKSKEQKQHFTNSIIHLENDISSINRDIEKIFLDMKKIFFQQKKITSVNIDTSSHESHTDTNGQNEQNQQIIVRANTDLNMVETHNVDLYGFDSKSSNPLVQNDVNQPLPQERRPTGKFQNSNVISPKNLNQEIRNTNLNIREDNNHQYGSEPNNDQESFENQFKELKSLITKKFDKVDKKLEKLDDQMQILMDMQQQNQEMLKSNMVNAEIAHQENSAQYINVELMYKQTKKEISQLKGEMAAGGRNSTLEAQPQNVNKQGRAESIMSQIVTGDQNHFGNLPMSRSKAKYPVLPSNGARRNNFTRKSRNGSITQQNSYANLKTSKSYKKKRNIKFEEQKSSSDLLRQSSAKSFKSSRLSEDQS